MIGEESFPCFASVAFTIVDPRGFDVIFSSNPFRSFFTAWCKKFLHVWISRLPPSHEPRAADAQPISPDGTCVTEFNKVFFARPCISFFGGLGSDRWISSFVRPADYQSTPSCDSAGNPANKTAILKIIVL